MAIEPSRTATVPRDPRPTRLHQTVRIHTRAPRVLPHYAGRLEAGDRRGASGSTEKGEGTINFNERRIFRNITFQVDSRCDYCQSCRNYMNKNLIVKLYIVFSRVYDS